MNIVKYLTPCISLLFFFTTGVYADDNDKKKCREKDGKQYHQKMWDKKGRWKRGPMHMFGPPPMVGMGGPFTMIEAQGKLFLYNSKTGDVWVCNAFKKICEQLSIENKDID